MSYTPKTMDIVVGAKIGPSTTALRKDLQTIFNQKLPAFKIKQIQLGNGVANSLQKQIQQAISSAKYTLSFDPRQVANNPSNGGGAKTISTTRVDTLKNYEAKLATSNYAQKLEQLHLPTNELTYFNKKLNEARTLYEQIRQANGGAFTTDLEATKADELISKYKEIERLFSTFKNYGAIEDPITQKDIDELNTYKLKIDETLAAWARMREIGAGSPASEADIARLQQLQAQLSTISPQVGEDGAARIKEIEREIEELIHGIDTVNGKHITINSAENLSRGIDNAAKSVDNLLRKYKKLETEAPDTYQRLNELKERLSAPGGIVSDRELEAVKTEISGIQRELEGGQHSTHKFSDAIKNRLIPQLGRMAVSFGVMAIRRGFSQMITSVKEVDKAMTELKKVTDLAADAYSNLQARAADTAVEIGAKVDDYINAVADFARLGYSVADSEELARTATIYKNVGDGIENIADASESVISTMKAFGIQAKDSMDIVDAFNEVGNNFAISSTGIGVALSNSAAALAAANNSLDESIGLIVAGNDVVQDPAKVGTALKTVSMFLRASKTEAEEAGEYTDGMAESVSKLRGALLQLTNQKVDIMADSGTYKSTYQILKELSEVWGDLSDINQAAILEKIGGKRQANVVTSILNNFKDAEAVLKTISQDEGSAMREQEKWLDSIEGKQNQLKASAQQLSLGILSSDFMKGTIETLTGIVNLVDKLVGHKGGLLAVLSAVSAFVVVIKSVKIAEGITKFITSLSSIGKILGILKSGAAGFKAMSASAAAAAAGMEGVSTAGAVLTATLGGLALAIAAVTIGFSIYYSHQQKLKQQAEEANRAYEESKSELEEYANTIKSVRAELDAAGSEEERYLKTKELKAIQAELVDKYGQQANSINLINGRLDDEIEKVKRLNAEQAKEALALNANERKKAQNAFSDSGISSLGFKIDAKGADRARDILNNSGYSVRATRITTNANSDSGRMAVMGDLAERKKALAALYDDAQKHADEYDEYVRKKIHKAYTEAISEYNNYADSVQETADQIIASADLSDPTQKQAYNNYNAYLKAIERMKQAVVDGDWDTASVARKQAIDYYNEVKKVWPEVGQQMKNMYWEYMDTDLKVKLQLVWDIKNNAAIKKTIQSLKNEFGDVVIPDDVFSQYQLSKDPGWKLLKKRANEYGKSIEEVIDLYNEMNEIELESPFESEYSGSISDQIDLLYDMEAGFDKLQKIYNDVKDKGQFDFGLLSKKDFLETFKIEGLEEEYNSFLETITKYPADLSKCQQAFNKLTTAYLEQSGVLDNLSQENRDLTVAYLKNMGVANAAEVVDSRLNQSIRVSQDEYEALNKVLGDTVKATKLANGAFEIEADTMRDLGVSAKDMAYIAAAAQQGMTFTTIAEAQKRIKAMQMEAEIYRDLYTAIKQANAAADVAQQGAFENRDSSGNLTGYRTQADIDRLNAYTKAQEQKQLDRYGLTAESEAYKDLQMWSKIEDTAAKKIDELDQLKAEATYTPPKTGSSKSGSSSSGDDKYLKEWKKNVDERKALVENDKMTQEAYYDWLAKAYTDPSFNGPAADLEKRKKYRDEVAEIEAEIYNWDKESVQKKINEENAILKNKRTKGLISESEYQKQIAKVTEDGYKELLDKIEKHDLYGVDTEERLNAETELLEEIKSAHIAEHDAELADLDHLRAMELITDEQYYTKRLALAQEYYGTEAMYREEMKKEEEELFKERTDMLKKYSSAAKQAISSIMDTGRDLADAIGNLVQGIIDANSSNFDLQKGLLKHQLEMNYITEKEYYDKLRKLYQTYYKSKSVYLDEYWENQEEIYHFEIESMENGASALEDIHAKVVEMIRDELDKAKDAIEETKKSYNELIDIRRKALEDEKDENDTERSRVEKLNEIAELTRQLNALRNDNSAAGQRKYKEVFAQLIEAKRALQEFEEDQAYKAATEQLDREAEAMEKASDAETAALDKQLEDNEWLVNEAWARLSGMNEDLYAQLIDYTRKHSTSIKDEVTGSWETAKDAFAEYKDNVKEGYAEISRTIAHPELYHRGIDDTEANFDASVVKQKEFENYAEVLGDFAEEIADIMGASVSSVAGILNTLFPGYITDLLVDGADIFSDSLGMVGISNSLMSTVAALGGIAGIAEMMNGFQDLAEGNTSSMGVAIGGENINSIIGLMNSIQQYGVGISGFTGGADSMLGLLLGAVTAGPSDSSSVVTGIGGLAAIAAALLTVGVTMLGGGGTGAATLLSALSGLGGLIGLNIGVDAENTDRLNLLIDVLLKVGNYVVGLFNTNTEINGEVGGLRNILQVAWKGIYDFISMISGGSGNTNLLGDLISSFSGSTSGVGYGAYNSLSGNLLSSAAGISSNLLKMLSGSGIISTGTIGSIASIISSLPGATSVARTNNVTVNPVFQIQSTDPSGVAVEIERLLPMIADYTIGALVDGANNKGVRRTVSSLV